MSSSPNRPTKKTAGFIISLEFLLVLTLVVFPIMLGLFLLGRKIVTLYLDHLAAIEQPLARPVVWDSTEPVPGDIENSGNKPIGAVIAYDAYDGPLILWRDNTTGSATYFPGVLLGVRRHRFTTGSSAYYTSFDCTGTPYVKTGAVLVADASKFSVISQLQSLNYAMGADNILWREDQVFGPQTIHSTWVSQDTDDSDFANTGFACKIADVLEDDLSTTVKVADLDDAPNFTRPFRLAFPRALPLVGPVSPNGGG